MKAPCIVCGQKRDPVTDLCPTPVECDRLRSPKRRQQQAGAAARARVNRSAVEHASISGLTRVSGGVPGTAWNDLEHARVVEARARGRR